MSFSMVHRLFFIHWVYILVLYFSLVLVSKPGNVKHVDAAAILKDAVRAYTALYYLAKVSSGDTILVFDGASVCS